MARVLLINPAWVPGRIKGRSPLLRRWPPLDLAIAGAMLERAGHTVRILDNGVERYSPSMVASCSLDHDFIFVTSSPYDRWQCPPSDIRPFFETVDACPKDRLFVTGAHVTEYPEVILQRTMAAAGIMREPETVILELVRAGYSRHLWKNIKGLAFYDGTGFVRTEDASAPALDDFPPPAYHLLMTDRYEYEVMGGDFAILEGSRGCPHACSFCYKGMFSKRYRQKSPDLLVDETRFIVRRFGIKNIYYMDLDFGVNRSWVHRFCSGLIKSGLKMKWCCQLRPDELDDGTAGLMKRAGCELIHFGFESGSRSLMKEAGKDSSFMEAGRAIKKARKAGIKTAGFFILGFPGESRAEMRRTIRYAIRLKPDYASFHALRFYPGARISAKGDDLVSSSSGDLNRMIAAAYLLFYSRRPHPLVRPAARVAVSCLAALLKGFKDARF